MISTVLTIIALLVLIGAGIWLYKIIQTKKDKKIFNKSQAIISSVIISFAGLFLIVVPASLHQVNTGEVAVVKVWGDAKYIRTAGVYFDNWLSTSYDIYDCKVQQVSISTQSYSSDGQTMDVELVIQFKIQQTKALDIAKIYGGLDMLENRIETVSTEKMKSVLAQRQAMTIIEERASISPAVETSIKNAITDDYYVDITAIVLTDIEFTKEFEKTVEDKMIAEQEKLKAEYEKEKAIIQAEQQLEVAKKEAEAQIALAKADAEAIELVAQANANSIKMKSIEIARMLGFTINEIVNEDSIEYNIDFTDKTTEEINTISSYLKYIQYLETWNGELPTTFVTDGTNATILIPVNE